MRRSKEQTQYEAIKRQETYDSLSTSQKIERLDKQFGKGIGAKKQRRRLGDV